MSGKDVNTNQSFPSKLFEPATIVMAMLLGILSWGGMQIVGIKEVQASNTTTQAQHEEKLKSIDEMLPQINNTLTIVSTNQTHMSSKIDKLAVNVSELQSDVSEVKTTNLYYKKLTATLLARENEKGKTSEKSNNNF